jgi:hypothetical protein
MPAELKDLSLNFLLMPPQRLVEPQEYNEKQKSGKWLCDPKMLNVLKIKGHDLPLSSIIFFKADNISWSPDAGKTTYTQPCPLKHAGGIFKQFNLHALVFGAGSQAAGCLVEISIPATHGTPAWVAVNDTNYADNTGSILVDVSWH